jgi:prepilin-type processing-associated H-X9-DG protein
LQQSAQARRQLELLRQALLPLAVDQEIVPPPRLALRTIAKVAEHVCRDLPRAPLPPRSEPAGRPWWRRADVLVAASLLAVFVGLGLPALVKLRQPVSALALVECQNNLRVFHQALKTYEDQHKQLPSLAQAPRNVAGMIVPVLNEAGTLPATFSVRCPGHGPFQTCSLTLDEIRAMTPEQFSQHAPNLLMSYAFTLGYRDENGVWHAISRLDDAGENAVLIFADNPPPSIATGNSLNHASKGQNVLYLDGHVRFLTARTLAGDDIYLNRANRVAAGLDSRDFVLGASDAKP